MAFRARLPHLHALALGRSGHRARDRPVRPALVDPLPQRRRLLRGRDAGAAHFLMTACNSKFKIQNANGAWARIALCLHFAFCILHYSEAPAHAQDLIGQPIVEIVIEQEGQPVTDALIRSLIETVVGEPLSMRDVRETEEHLYNLRRFDDIQPRAEAVPGGVRLRYVLFPSHPVDRVDFRGMLGVSEGDLRRVIADRFGRTPAAARRDEVAERVRLAYRQRGYPSA